MQHKTAYPKQSVIKNGIGKNQADELDFISLIQKGISFIYRFKIILLSCLFAGLALGLYFYISSPKQYSTKLIMQSGAIGAVPLLSNQDQIEIIDSWQDLLSKGQKTQLAAAMNCNVSIIEKLSRISAEEILKTYTVNNPNGFFINVTVSDVSVLDKLQDGIVYGLNNSPYVKDRIAARRARDTELIEKVNGEIAKLNATKNLIDSMIRTKTTSSSFMIDISRINAQWIDLNEKLLSYQEDLKFLSGVQVLQSFNKGKMSRPGLLKFSILGIGAGCFIGYILSLLMYAFQKVKASENDPDTYGEQHFIKQQQ